MVGMEVVGMEGGGGGGEKQRGGGQGWQKKFRSIGGKKQQPRLRVNMTYEAPALI